MSRGGEVLLQEEGLRENIVSPTDARRGSYAHSNRTKGMDYGARGVIVTYCFPPIVSRKAGHANRGGSATVKRGREDGIDWVAWKLDPFLGGAHWTQKAGGFC